MKKGFFLILLILLVGQAFAQSENEDTIVRTQVDSAHKPKIATIAALVLPGTGHIYNEIYKIKGQKNTLWWKLPIVYGGLGTAGYFIVSNHQNYRNFKNERIARLDDTYISTEFAFLSDSQLKVYQDQYERWRNLSIIGGLAVYVLQVIDANVEAHLMHFDTSDDLSFHLTPNIIPTGFRKSVGISLRISF